MYTTCELHVPLSLYLGVAMGWYTSELYCFVGGVSSPSPPISRSGITKKLNEEMFLTGLNFRHVLYRSA